MYVLLGLDVSESFPYVRQVKSLLMTNIVPD